MMVLMMKKGLHVLLVIKNVIVILIEPVLVLVHMCDKT